MTRALLLLCLLLLVPASVAAQDGEGEAPSSPSADVPAAPAESEEPATEHAPETATIAEAVDPVSERTLPSRAEAASGSLDAPATALPEPLEYEDEDEPSATPQAGDALVGSTPRHLLGVRLGVWAELSITSGGPEDSRVTAFVPEVGLRYRVADALVADVSFGMLVADTQVSGAPTIAGESVPFEGGRVLAEPGNPVFRGLFAHDEADWHLEVGAGVAIPSAARAEVGNDADALTSRAASEGAYRASMAMRGWWSPWRFAPERVSIVVPARLVGVFGGVQLEGEAGLGVMIPVLGDRGVDADVVLQLAAGAAFEPVEHVQLGAKVRAVGGALGTTLPGAIASAEPWVRLDFAPFHTTVRGVLNLNGMDGLVGRRGPGFGVFVGVGGSD